MASAWAGVNSASVSERRRACRACASYLSPKTLTPKGRADSDEPPGGAEQPRRGGSRGWAARAATVVASGTRGAAVARLPEVAPSRRDPGVAAEPTVPFASIQFSRRSLRPTSGCLREGARSRRPPAEPAPGSGPRRSRTGRPPRSGCRRCPAPRRPRCPPSRCPRPQA